MIVGFEPYTEPLSLEEKELKIYIEQLLSNRIGKEEALTNKAISEHVYEDFGVKVNGARIRKIINAIRHSGNVPLLIASSKGYYISDDKEEILTYLLSLRQRAVQIFSIHHALEKQYCEEFEKGNQLKINM